jgi:hypothetical protein
VTAARRPTVQGHERVSVLRPKRAFLAGCIAMKANDRAAQSGHARVCQHSPRVVRQSYAFIAASVTASTWWTWMLDDGTAVISGLPVSGLRRRLSIGFPSAFAGAILMSTCHLVARRRPSALSKRLEVLSALMTLSALVFQMWRDGPSPLALHRHRAKLRHTLRSDVAIELTAFASARRGAGYLMRDLLIEVADESETTVVVCTRTDAIRKMAIESGFEVICCVTDRRNRRLSLLLRRPA